MVDASESLEKLKEAFIQGYFDEVFDGKNGEKIAAEIVNILAREDLTIRAAYNVLKLCKTKLKNSKISL